MPSQFSLSLVSRCYSCSVSLNCLLRYYLSHTDRMLLSLKHLGHILWASFKELVSGSINFAPTLLYQFWLVEAGLKFLILLPESPTVGILGLYHHVWLLSIFIYLSVSLFSNAFMGKEGYGTYSILSFKDWCAVIMIPLPLSFLLQLSI